MQARRQVARRHQRGVVAIEFGLVFLVFFALLWAILTFGFIFAVQQTLTLSAENGARAALRYQPATSVASGTALRVAAAAASSSNSLQWLEQFDPSYSAAQAITVTAPACSYNAALVCFTVKVTYPYGKKPLIPPLPLFGLLAPKQLQGIAVMQVDPGNLILNP
jgi:Flp pilus assembly protein TadG